MIMYIDIFRRTTGKLLNITREKQYEILMYCNILKKNNLKRIIKMYYLQYH